MITDELSYRIRSALPFEPTAEQSHAIDVFGRFMTARDSNAVMIMRGSAGTGKTSLSGAVVRAMESLGQKMILLAPTGRAAKVLSVNSGHKAFTIHRRIYRQRTFTGEMSGFNLNVNLHRDTLFIVDEASMIANQGLSETQFGSGRLLDDLVEYVYSGTNCRMMIVGDKAQLPPVGESESPALIPDIMSGYGLTVYDCELNEVLRQTAESGILWNATVIRGMITHDDVTQLPLIRFKGFADIHIVYGNDLIEQLNSSYSDVGTDDTIVVTRSNKRAFVYNMGIRGSILDREEQLSTGDMLMVAKNNYFFLNREAEPEKSGKSMPAKHYEQRNRLPKTGTMPYDMHDNGEQNNNASDFIANGDRAIVQRVRNIRELYGFSFADVWLRFPDYDNTELQATVILDSLTSETPALTREQQEHLFNSVANDYQDLPRKAERMKSIRADRHYNALQVKYAYAITCHKAQGGQWAHVYIDQGYMTDEMLTPDYIHWLYTAFTRATEQLFLVNWPKTQTEQ